MTYLDEEMNIPIQIVEEIKKRKFKTDRMLLGDLVWNMNMHPDSAKYLVDNLSLGQAVVFQKADRRLMLVAKDDDSVDLLKYMKKNYDELRKPPKEPNGDGSDDEEDD